jgi:hypothetical protein
MLISRAESASDVVMFIELDDTQIGSLGVIVMMTYGGSGIYGGRMPRGIVVVDLMAIAVKTEW